MICCYITAVPGNALVTSTDTSHIVENYSALLQLRAGFPKKFWVIKSPALSYCTKHNNLQKCRIAWFKSKQITGLRPYFMFLWYYNYSWSGISFLISHVDIKKTLTGTQMLLGNINLHLYNVCTRTLQCKIQNFKRPPKDTTASGLLSPAGSVSSAEGSGGKRGREVDVVLHSLWVCLVCILTLLFCLFSSLCLLHFPLSLSLWAKEV